VSLLKGGVHRTFKQECTVLQCIGIYVYRIFYNALLDNYKTVEQDGKTVANEMSKTRMY